MCVKRTINKYCGHPMDQSPGWEGMNIIADTKSELEMAIAMAGKRYWELWIVGTVGYESDLKPAAYLYRPKGARKPWSDTADR